MLESKVERLELEDAHTEGEPANLHTEGIEEESPGSNNFSPQDASMTSASHSPIKMDKLARSPSTKVEKHEEVIGGDVIVKQEPGQPPKLSRSTSHKIISRPPQLFDNHPDKTKEARETFQLISECSYTSKYIGSTEHDSMDCDCAEEWGKPDSPSAAHSHFG